MIRRWIALKMQNAWYRAGDRCIRCAEWWADYRRRLIEKARR